MNPKPQQFPDLAIPFFEYLKLTSWIRMAASKPVIGLGRATALSGRIVVEGFTLVKQKPALTLPELLNNSKWELATADQDNSLLWVYDSLMLLPHGLPDLVEQLYELLRHTLTQCTVMIMDGHNNLACFFMLSAPIRIMHPLVARIFLPTVDTAARDHWVGEFTDCTGKGQDENEDSGTLLSLLPKPYRFSFAPHDVFFREMEAPLAEIECTN